MNSISFDSPQNMVVTHEMALPVMPLALERLARAKAAYTTRRVDLNKATTLLKGDLAPQVGDLVLARVVKIGQHRRIELRTGRRSPLFIGDEIVVCYGHRYAPDQFEAEVPPHLENCHLVAAGGIASMSLSRNEKIKAATDICPIGLLADAQGQRINIADGALPTAAVPPQRPITLAVAGTAMNAGKTTSAAHIIKGLSRAGLRVGAAKVTGTGAGGDTWLMRDAGADPVFDFTDAGLASTFSASLPQLEEVVTTLIGHLQQAAVDVIVLEVADGLFQTETAALLQSPVFQELVDGLVFAAGDAMGATAGVEWLRQRQLPIVAVSGALSASPLAVRETQQATGLPVLGLEQLSDPLAVTMVFEHIQSGTALPLLGEG